MTKAAAREEATARTISTLPLPSTLTSSAAAAASTVAATSIAAEDLVAFLETKALLLQDGLATVKGKLDDLAREKERAKRRIDLAQEDFDDRLRRPCGRSAGRDEGQDGQAKHGLDGAHGGGARKAQDACVARG